jgi:Tfp pilus assembly protein PilO
MSYGIRNSLILLGVLLLLGLGGWGFIHYFYSVPVVEKGKELEDKKQFLLTYTEKAKNYADYERGIREMRFYYDNHTKTFFPNSSVAVMFDYLRSINVGDAATSMNFTLVDSVLNDQYGEMIIKLNGGGQYYAFYNFVSMIEQSQPMIKITDLSITTSTNSDGSESDFIMYDATLRFFFNRATSIETPDLLINRNTPRAVHNPFNPLVKSAPTATSDATSRTSTTAIDDADSPPPPPPNREGLPEINRSKLLGFTVGGVLLEDHKGEIVEVKVGGRVYLGTLTEISLAQKTARFRITRNGRAETVTLRITGN